MTAEEEEFERAFSSMMSESMERGRSATVNPRQILDNMMVPVGLSLPQGARSVEESEAAGGGGGAPQAPRVVLTMLKRKGTGKPGAGGGKIEARPLFVPDSVAIALASTRASATRAAEAEELKARTLALHAQMEEESERSRRPQGGGWRGKK